MEKSSMDNEKNNQFFNGPNAITLLALLTVWLAIVFLLQGQFYLSFALVLLAFIVDFADGWLARKLGISSDFGRLLDGQVDVFIYLVYPALAFYLFFGLQDIGSIIVIFIFLASGVFRLARFNVLGYVSGFNYPGLPVVFSHLLVLLFLIFKLNAVQYFVYISDVLIMLTSILMLSTFPFPKPKKISGFVIFLAALIAVMLYLHFYGSH
jgi:CDP-diacylglycerol---serine O-phosphatidyltransferase